MIGNNLNDKMNMNLAFHIYEDGCETVYFLEPVYRSHATNVIT